MWVLRVCVPKSGSLANQAGVGIQGVFSEGPDQVLEAANT